MSNRFFNVELTVVSGYFSPYNVDKEMEWGLGENIQELTTPPYVLFAQVRHAEFIKDSHTRIKVCMVVVGEGSNPVTTEGDVEKVMRKKVRKLTKNPHIESVKLNRVEFVKEAPDDECVTWRHGCPGRLIKEPQYV